MAGWSFKAMLQQWVVGAPINKRMKASMTSNSGDKSKRGGGEAPNGRGRGSEVRRERGRARDRRGAEKSPETSGGRRR